MTPISLLLEEVPHRLTDPSSSFLLALSRSLLELNLSSVCLDLPRGRTGLRTRLGPIRYVELSCLFFLFF